MGQHFGFETITLLVRDSNTQVHLPSGAYLRIGGQGYPTTSSITCITSVSGFGGIDTGSVAASTTYYVYAVISASTVGLVASTSNSAPTGFTSYEIVGAFETDGSSNISTAYNYQQIGSIPVADRAAVLESASFTQYIETSEQTLSAGSTSSAPHGFSGTPRLWKGFLRCKTGELGWAAGDELQMSSYAISGTVGNNVWADSSAIRLRVGNGLTITRRDTDADANITLGNWRFFARAWK